MAVLQTILNLFGTPVAAEPERIVPAPPTTYTIRPLTITDLDDVLRLNLRCFRNGENYTKHTFSYLLNESGTLSYQLVTAEGQMAGFIFVMVNPEGVAHITTVGIAPEHRRRGLAGRLLEHLDYVLRAKKIGTAVLEVRVGNLVAQHLYNRHGYTVTQKIAGYYNNGEDGYLMMKSIV
jgi:[ribosomal protein S18]-alanine N-acetyltransferase